MASSTDYNTDHINCAEKESGILASEEAEFQDAQSDIKDGAAETADSDWSQNESDGDELAHEHGTESSSQPEAHEEWSDWALPSSDAPSLHKLTRLIHKADYQLSNLQVICNLTLAIDVVGSFNTELCSRI